MAGAREALAKRPGGFRESGHAGHLTSPLAACYPTQVGGSAGAVAVPPSPRLAAPKEGAGATTGFRYVHAEPSRSLQM